MPTIGTRYHGKKGVVYLGATVSPAAASRVYGLTEWSLQQTQDIVEVTALGDSSKSFVAGTKGATISMKGSWLSDYDVPFDAFDIGGKVTCYLYPSADSAGQFFWFNAWPTAANVSDPVAGAVALDFSGTVDGDVTRNG